MLLAMQNRVDIEMDMELKRRNIQIIKMDTELKKFRKLTRKHHLELTATVCRLQARVAMEVFHNQKLEERVEKLSKQMRVEKKGMVQRAPRLEKKGMVQRAPMQMKRNPKKKR